MKRFLKITGTILLALCLILCGFLTYLTVTEYRPEDRSVAETEIPRESSLTEKDSFSILTWNIGYAGLDSDADFFMDGGKMVNPVSQEHVENNLSSISDYLKYSQDDIYLLQEIDRQSKRTDYREELSYISESANLGWAYAANYRCNFVPYPFPPIGKMDAGIATMTNFQTSGDSERISLPCPFSWPVRAANLKRCLLVSRFPIDDSGHELVTVNLHLEAYDYVIAGGDFNQVFPDSLTIYPIKNPELWEPGVLQKEDLPAGWSFAYDTSTPSCRLLNQPYDPNSKDTQYYVIDGFLVSPNVKIESVKTEDLGFANSDHNPVRLRFSLNKEE